MYAVFAGCTNIESFERTNVYFYAML